MLTNSNSDEIARNVSVNVALYDAAGTVVAVRTDYAAVVLPNQRAAVVGFTEAAGVTRIEVQLNPQSWEPLTNTPGTFNVSGVNLAPQRFLGLKVTGTLASTFAKDLEQIRVDAVFLDANDQIVGGAFSFLDLLPAGGTAAFEVQSLGDVPGVEKVDVIPSLSNLTLFQQ